MGEYIPNRIRCKNCEHFKKTEDKNVGICKKHSTCGCTIFVIPNQQIPICFIKGGKM